MIPSLTKPLTLAEFLQLSETKPASEFIDGQIFQKPTPQGKHSTLQLDIGTAINLALKPEHIARAYAELRCTFGERSIVPDISVFSWDRIPRDANGQVANSFNLAPDWTIEILSPAQKQTKVVRNIFRNTFHCLAHGTQLGWLIDPEEALVFVYFADQRVVLLEQAGDRIPTPAFAPAFNLTVGELLGWLDE